MTSLRALVLLGVLCAAGLLRAEPLTLPPERRPDWVQRDGIVMAGSWEPLMFRVRRDGKSCTPTPEQLEGYRREQSPEMVAQLKALGVNFVMMHCYKGAGLEAERESMADAVRFSKLCHDAGLRVGVYNFSGAFLWEPFFKETPQAKDWVVRGPDGKPVIYDGAGYRYYWNRNHPDAEAFYRQFVRFAVEEIHTDLVHFDNYSIGPGFDANSVARFRRYLRETFTPGQFQSMGLTDVDAAQPPRSGSPELLTRAWQEFCCWSLAESYYAMSRYARSLRPDVLVECNPNGIGPAIHPPIDHGRLLQGGEAYWVESGRIGYRDGRLESRIRNYKIGRAMQNITFDYTLTPLEMAESMAFNADCLGCIGWFEYGKIVAEPGSRKPASPLLAPYVRFFHQRRDLLRGASVVADVAVLRSFPSQVFGGPKCSSLTARVEDLLIENRACFQILHDHQLGDLKRYRALVLAGCAALGDREIEQICRYVAEGGRLCVIGPLATHDAWMLPRPKPALDDLPAVSVVRAGEKADWLAAIRQACGGTGSLAIEGKPHDGQTALAGLCAELTEQPNRRLVHLVNYRSDGPIRDVSVALSIPQGRRVKSVSLASPDRPADRSLAFQADADKVRFTVPDVAIYEIAAVECAEADKAELIPPAAKIKTDRPRVLLRPGMTPYAISLEQLRALPRDTDFKRILEQLKGQQNAAAQALVWLLTQDEGAADRAIKRMRAYRYPGNVDTFHIYFRLMEFGLAYDWLYDCPRFTREAKAEVRAQVAPLVREAIKVSNDHMFHNYIWMSAGGATIWGLATVGEDETSDRFFEQIRQRFNNGLYPAWRYLDGLPSEPMGYWALYVFSPGVWTLLGAQSAFETDLVAAVRKDQGGWLDRHFENLIHSTLPDMRYIPWGDLQSGPNGGVTMEMAGVIDAATWTLRSPQGAWFSRWLAAKRGLSRFRDDTAIFYLLYTRQLKTEPAAPPLSFLAGNRQSGHFIARSGWDDGATVVAFTCTDHFGDHHHYDQGSFLIYRNGLLAVDPPVYRQVRGPQQKTEHHNTLLIGGQPQRPARGQWFKTVEEFQKNLQAGRKLETGDILFSHDAGPWAATTGQFAQAYDCETLKSCVRQVLFVRPDKVIVVDQLAAVPGRELPEVQWLLQLPSEPKVEAGSVQATSSKSWIRCHPILPSVSNPEVTKTPVNTHRASFRYPGKAGLVLVHALEVGDGVPGDKPARIEARQSEGGIEVTVNEQTFRFNSGPSFEVK